MGSFEHVVTSEQELRHNVPLNYPIPKFSNYPIG